MGPALRPDEDDDLGGVEDPQLPAEADLDLDGGEQTPACRGAVPQRLPPAVRRQRLVDRLEQRHPPSPAVGDASTHIPN